MEAYLCECHFGDDGEHDLLALGRVRVLLVLVEPRLQRRRRLPRRVLPPRRQIVTAAVSEVEGSESEIDERGNQLGVSFAQGIFWERSRFVLPLPIALLFALSPNPNLNNQTRRCANKRTTWCAHNSTSTSVHHSAKRGRLGCETPRPGCL